MYQYLFFLGREPDISTAELRAVFSSDYPSAHITKIHTSHAWAASPHALPHEALMNRLGGTIKIAEEIALSGDMAEALAAYLDAAAPEGKLHFSLFGGSKNLPAEVKRALKYMGRSVRYVEPKNTATILHNNLVERKSDLTILDGRAYATLAIQPIEAWSERDFGRPGRDAKSGMLPPKLARIMLNIAGAPRDGVLLDPFCGSGTIITEAMLLGYTNLRGSDISGEAVEDTKKNIEWTRKKSPEHVSARARKHATIEPNVFVSAVRDITKKLAPHSIDAIVTEPFLGRPLRGGEPDAVLKRQANELSALYLSAFRSFKSVLKPGGTVLCILPRFRMGKEWLRVACEKEVAGLGFSIVPLADTEPFLLYSRPDQRVAREIWKFERL